LVVDDNPINLKVFVSLLKPMRICVDVADSGKASIEMVETKHYDLIFMDHMMPEMDGIETLQHMKRLENNLCEGSPVVALTANAITGAKEMYLSEGFDAFLPKPINPEKLEQMILKLLPRELLRFEDGKQDETSASSLQAAVQVHEKYSEETELPVVDGIDWSYGRLHLPRHELLMGTVSDFCKTLETEADMLEEFYGKSKENQDMLTQYRIKVHSMKSSANMIGATTLGGVAKLLEDAAGKSDIATIDALHNIFVKEWRSYKEKLKECIEETKDEKQNGEEKKVAEDNAVIITRLEELREAMTEFDIDLMDEIMSKLEGYLYSEQIQNLIEKLSAYVTNMDCDRAEDIISELINLMQ